MRTKRGRFDGGLIIRNGFGKVVEMEFKGGGTSFFTSLDTGKKGAKNGN